MDPVLVYVANSWRSSYYLSFQVTSREALLLICEFTRYVYLDNLMPFIKYSKSFQQLSQIVLTLWTPVGNKSILFYLLKPGRF